MEIGLWFRRSICGPGSVLLLGLAPGIHAADCFSRSPYAKPAQDPYEAISPTTLSRRQKHSLAKLFQELRGRWTGRATGFICGGKVGAARKRMENQSVVSQVDVGSSGALAVRSDLTSRAKRTTRTETLRLFIAANRLRVNRNNRAGDAEVLSLSDSTLHTRNKELHARGGGAAGFTEISRRIRLSGSTLAIQFAVYTQGGLSAQSMWSLKRR